MNISEKMTNEAKPKRDKNQNIQVFVRVRPLNSQEKNSKCALVVDTPGSKEVNVTEKSSSTKTFSFDRVFGSDSKQVDVYKTVAAPLLQEVLNGYNCTVFCYGQTGTGKTFTMEGDKCNDPSVSWENDPLSGIIPRTLNNLFDELRIQEVECTVRVSFIELYNEDIYDLLSPSDDTTKLRLFEDTAKKGSVIIQGVEEVTVHNKDEVYQILAKGSEKRQTASTLLNAHSSRSHTIFSLTVHIKENTDDGEELMKIGKLNLVDLAGSENIGRSGAVDRRAREAGNINQSLLTLGRVITGLVERAPHIPYRESKLTRLLQDSLGGRTKTSIIATISPASCNVEETLSTLDYAHRARNITNRPEVNQKLTKRALLKEYTEEIERLRRDLLACREKTGIYLATENYTQIMSDAETQKREIVDKTLQLRAMEEELARKEEAFVNLQQVLARREEELTEKTKKLVHTKEKLVKTHQEYVSTCKDRDEKHHLVKAHLATERTLGDQAKKLLEVAQHSTQDLSKMHSKMDRKRSIEEENNRISHDFRQSFTQNLVRMEDRLMQFTQKQADFCKDMRNNLGERLEKRGKELTAVSEQMSSLVRSQGSVAGDLQKTVADQTQEGQKFLQTLIKNTRMESESQVASMQAFLMQSFLPKLQQISQNLLDESQTVLQMKKTLDQQMALQNEAVHTFVTEQREALSRVRADSQRLLLGQRESLQVINHLKKNIDQANAAKQADFSQYVSSIQALLVSMEKSQSAHDSQLVSGVEGLTVAIENQGSGLTDLGGLLDGICRDETQRSHHLETQHTSRASDLGEKINEYMDKHADSNLSATKLVEATETEMRGHVSNAQAAWQSLHTAQEAAVRTEMDSLAQGLKRHGALCQGMMSTVHAAAQTQETLLEDQRTDFTTYVREHQDDLEGRCSAVSDWATLMNAELRARDEDVHKFLTEDLRTELSTGKTPQRRDFQFPRFLASTSPHDRILERFRHTAKVEVPELDISLPERMALDEEMDVARLPAGSVPSSPVLKAPALPVRSSSLLNLQRDQEPLVKSESSQSLNSTSKENKENASEKSTGLNGSDGKREPKLPEARTSQNRKKALIPNN